MTRKKLYLLAVLSGMLLTISWPPHGLPFLLFIAFVPLFRIEHAFSSGEVKENPWQLFGLSYLAFFIWNIITTFWIWNASEGGAVAAILFNTLFMSMVFWIFHVVKKRLLTLNSRLQTLNWLFVFFWLAYEFIHHSWELTWPWLGLGNAFASLPKCIQWYEYTGTCGGSLWVLILNKIIFDFILNKSQILNPKSQIAKIVLVILIPIGISLGIYYSYEEKSAPVNIVAVQPNIDPYSEKFSTMNFEAQLDKMLELAKQKTDSTTDYLVFPETALTEDIWENNLYRTVSMHKLKDFIKDYPKLKIVVGAATAYVYEDGEKLSVTARKFKNEDGYYDQYNTALQVDSGYNIQVYHKSKLVPGVERMPYPGLFGFLGSLAIDLGGSSGSLGTQEERDVFTSASGAIAPVICYESIFGEFVTGYVHKGANMIFIITNDGWWGNTPGFKQHLQYGRLRAIETRRSIARSANTGVSCFINQRGDISQETEWWVPDVIKGSINSNTGETFYVRNGDIIWRVSFWVSAIVLIYSIALFLKARFSKR